MPLSFLLAAGRSVHKGQGDQTRRHEDDHLAKMMELTGETFSEKLLSVSEINMNTLTTMVTLVLSSLAFNAITNSCV
jgi:hypothetical protein